MSFFSGKHFDGLYGQKDPSGFSLTEKFRYKIAIALHFNYQNFRISGKITGSGMLRRAETSEELLRNSEKEKKGPRCEKRLAQEPSRCRRAEEVSPWWAGPRTLGTGKSDT